ncbi:sensor domain-containing protein [Mycobacterium vicinigordonae]|uniref:non-specific serine/threonine protein kinase n=2 Tax=Mycobacterium vicinigordonae TaxID=1719132 RepID=A0A7D6E688_9MYCO|nr:sensor domain-containing protein [Mycobacterium vicinigordonae]
MLNPGSIVAGYRVERVLGAGGMGEVYQVADPNLPRYAALKVLPVALSDNSEFRARFLREADIAARLDHPNIVSIYDRGQTEQGQLWIAMQFVDGTDAANAVRAGAMTPARAVYIVGEVAKALDYAHHRGVLHRDVKPANFLLSGPAGGDERVLLADFGIARALGETGLTGTGAGMVTLSYAAPEVIAGGHVDARADLYSLGCSLFQLLCGTAPFARDGGVAAVVAAHLHAPPPRVSERVPGLPSGMDAVIATALAKDPAHRYTSARQLAAAAAAALHPVLPAVHPGPAVAYPVPAAPRDPGRRNLILAAVVGLSVMAAAVALAVTMIVRSPAPRSAAPPSSATPRTSTSTTPATPAAAPPAAVSALPGLLLPPDQIASLLGVRTMTVSDSSSHGFTDDTPYISDKECTGPYAPADQGAFGRSGSVGAQLQLLSNPDGPNAVEQAVIAFPSAAAAQQVLAEQQRQWSACSGRTFTVTTPNETPTPWTFGPLTTPGGTLVMSFTSQVRSSVSCQRAMAARNNVIVDVAANGFDVGNHGVDVLNAIVAKVPS